MKKTYQLHKKAFSTLLLLIMGIAPSLAYNNVWVKAEAYPTGAGTVYVNWNDDPETVVLDDAAEFKRSTNAGASTAFIFTEAADGYQLAGFARDNGNQRYDNGIDWQIKVRSDGFFTAVYDHTEYGDAGSSSTAQIEAEAALEDMTTPTDYIFAVFTQGDVVRQAEGQENFGWVYCDKLDNEPGDEITLDAYGDSDNSEGIVRFYKFDHWTDATGNVISRDRIIKLTAKGGEVYYAHFVETTEEDRDVYNPHKETAVRDIIATPAGNSNTYHNLQGIRYDRLPATRGIYVREGRKTIIK